MEKLGRVSSKTVWRFYRKIRVKDFNHVAPWLAFIGFSNWIAAFMVNAILEGEFAWDFSQVKPIQYWVVLVWLAGSIGAIVLAALLVFAADRS